MQTSVIFLSMSIKFVLAGAGSAVTAVEHFLNAVKTREFPGPEHCP
jgi:ketopantoate hydroxymethyltransferase